MSTYNTHRTHLQLRMSTFKCWASFDNAGVCHPLFLAQRFEMLNVSYCDLNYVVVLRGKSDRHDSKTIVGMMDMSVYITFSCEHFMSDQTYNRHLLFIDSMFHLVYH